MFESEYYSVHVKQRPVSPTTQRVARSIILFVIAFVSGCNESDSLVTDFQLESSFPISNPVADPQTELPVTKVSDKRPVDLKLEEIDFPSLPDNVNFFMPPKTTAVKVEVDAPEQAEAKTVRLIGFVSSDPDDESSTLALLRVGNKLIPLYAGEEVDGISLLSTDMITRSAEIRHMQERLTLVMMDQPIVNQAVTSLATPPQRRSDRRSPLPANRSALPIEVTVPTPQFSSPSDPSPSLGAIPSGLHLELPSDLALPEMPDLPGLEGLPTSL